MERRFVDWAPTHISCDLRHSIFIVVLPRYLAFRVFDNVSYFLGLTREKKKEKKSFVIPTCGKKQKLEVVTLFSVYDPESTYGINHCRREQINMPAHFLCHLFLTLRNEDGLGFIHWCQMLSQHFRFQLFFTQISQTSSWQTTRYFFLHTLWVGLRLQKIKSVDWQSVLFWQIVLISSSGLVAVSYFSIFLVAQQWEVDKP